ncbi:phosphatase PAP2 family protein [Methanobacterium sp. ACI-7]|uniref:phosphatase PAP2 family protein n=1 Tax=unclassified Methanobacterium TaxID=2627676 RepID=UPI0039C3B8AA
MIDHFKMTEDFKKDFAHLISSAAYAPLISVPVFALINYFLLSFHDFIIITIICAVFAGLIPILFVIGWLQRKKKNGKEIDMDIPERTDRHLPLIFVIISYLIGTIVLYTLNAPAITTILMLCYFSNTLIVFFINLYWKISLHAMGVAGPAVVLIYVFGPIATLFAAIIPLVMWSRVYLEKHTSFQVLMGTILGILSTTVQIYLLI